MKRVWIGLTTLALTACAATQAPSGESVATNAPAAEAAPFVAPKPKAEGPAFNLPEYEVVTLSNGLTLYLMARHQVPIITASAVVRAGAVNDSEPGMAALTAEGLLLGTTTTNKVVLEQAIESLGADLQAYSGKEGTTLNGRFLAKDMETMLPLMAEVLTQPRFPSGEVKKARDRYVAQLAQQKEQPRAVVGSYFDSLFYGSHPYANAAMGEAESVSVLDAFDLKMFHGSWYQPGNTALVVVGDFDRDEMLALVERSFGRWRDNDTPTPPDLTQPVSTPEQARVLLVNKSDARETTFMIGGPGIPRTDPDYVGLQVVNTVLGGRFTSWLNDELRVNAGLTYGARSRFSTLGQHGSFVISTFTATETTKEAVDLALTTYRRLWTQGLDQATLDSAKAYVKGQFPPRFETSDQLAGLLSQMHLYGLGPEQINAFQAEVDGLTLDKAQALIERHFPKDNLQFVMVGKAEAIRPIAERYGQVEQVEITDSGFQF
ncbi:M16 family metallopeptidase [Ferrimonas marina]|uniref:DNA-directed RNA polymerase n=1 Tax=Ferrimonas marina TaxID=299255 RepID=A0A1M5ZAW0_9GAMM|nr:pitrilysin family protein [Ferrimonas marina]SHI21381.1 DNA-directed RNA polymerase [Ferrimonas marina]